MEGFNYIELLRSAEADRERLTKEVARVQAIFDETKLEGACGELVKLRLALNRAISDIEWYEEKLKEAGKA